MDDGEWLGIGNCSHCLSSKFVVEYTHRHTLRDALHEITTLISIKIARQSVACERWMAMHSNDNVFFSIFVFIRERVGVEKASGPACERMHHGNS